MPDIHTKCLDEFIDTMNLAGGDLEHPAIKDRFEPFHLRFDTTVDRDVDPFSDEYFRQQLDLYREISGRELKQEDGELHPGDAEANVRAANPINIYNVEDVGEHVRSVSSMFVPADLKGRAQVLDLGAGMA